MEYFSSQKFLVHAGIILLSVVLYIIFLRLKPIFFRKLSEIINRKKVLRDIEQNTEILMKIFLILILINVLLDIPFIEKYAKEVLKKPILSTEALKISFYSFLKGLIVFYVLLVLMRLIRDSVRLYLIYKARGKEIVSSVDILIYNFSLLLIILITLSVMGISWKLLIPIAGALGIGIGFGIQDIVNNFVSGFIILFSRTVKRGDWITLGDKFGKIVDIGIRTSTLRTLDNIDIIIPNSRLISGELINWSYTDNIVRLHIPVGVSYSSDVELVKETLLDVARKSSVVLDTPSPEVRFIEFGESSLNFELLVWIDIKKVPVPLAKSDINFEIWNAFKKNGIEIPFPQRDVWFKNELVVKEAPKG
ncbi:Mechanosensitive ion channel [Persephonella hydrogeniphila]|uniref:Mechanosensitive ion channel n=1 Tax=Persephonella hydrogeniphila TaxID=198703 RepID=A0A285MZN6_9AQUI|nr:mechanosensitive ion channel domain-containing protein [Persephonella hydrogeniphila]SNZ02143.1 Mechanosensitive ion channel [Persephonella hydrogeniphila]